MPREIMRELEREHWDAESIIPDTFSEDSKTWDISQNSFPSLSAPHVTYTRLLFRGPNKSEWSLRDS